MIPQFLSVMYQPEQKPLLSYIPMFRLQIFLVEAERLIHCNTRDEKYQR